MSRTAASFRSAALAALFCVLASAEPLPETDFLLSKIERTVTRPATCAPCTVPAGMPDDADRGSAAGDVNPYLEKIREAVSPARRAPIVPEKAKNDALAKLFLASLSDGSADPSDPRWRPLLVRALEKPVRDLPPDDAYRLLLATFPGVDAGTARKRLREWAAECEGGLHLVEVLLSESRVLFSVRNWEGSLAAAEAAAAVAGNSPELSARAAYRKGLALAGAGRTAEAVRVLRSERDEHPESRAAPEIEYAIAWAELRGGDEKAAAETLRRLIRERPADPVAEKARQTLGDLEDVR